MELSLDPRQILWLFWRRKWLFIFPAVLVMAVTVVLLFTLPPVYRSQAGVLIEDQNIPENIVPSLIGDYVDRRLELLNRRVLTPQNLSEIIERHNLYPLERETRSTASLAQTMRENVKMEVITAPVNDPRSGRQGQTTVAFRIAFDYQEPRLAQRVTDDLVSLYLTTNIEERRAVATNTTSFLAAERATIDSRVANLEEEFSQFKSENQRYLPEETRFSRQLLMNIERQLQSLDSNMRALRERESFLQTQLALTNEYDVSAGRGVTPESQLELLRVELATARARYSQSHPDVVRLQREVRALEQAVGQRSGASDLAQQEAQLVADLSRLRERYTDDHPDVRNVERQLASVRQAMVSAGRSGGGNAVDRNPTFVQLSAQLNSVQAEIRATAEQREQLMQDRVDLQERLARAPVVEREYQRLSRTLENAIVDRDALADKEATAQLSGALEVEAIGERLVLTEPASLPRAPVSPNKKLLLAVGLVLAMGSGGFGVIAGEILDRSVRSQADLVKLIGEVPLVQIPILLSPWERRRAWFGRVTGVVLLVGTGVGGLAYVNYSVVPLEVLWFQTQNWAEGWARQTFQDTPTVTGTEPVPGTAER